MKKEYEKLQEELKEVKDKLQEVEQRERELVIKHNEEIKKLDDELEQERQMAEEGIRELSKLSNKRERMLQSSIAEISEYMNQLIKDRKDKTSTNVTQFMLKKLATDKQASSDDHFFRSNIVNDGEDPFSDFLESLDEGEKRQSIKGIPQYQYISPHDA